MAELFIRCVPKQWGRSDLESCLQPHLSKLSIHTFHCDKPKSRDFGFLTLMDQIQAQLFLEVHGPPRHGRSASQKPVPIPGPRGCLKFDYSNQRPDDLRIKSLKDDERKRKDRISQVGIEPGKHKNAPASRKFPYRSLQCGFWGLERSEIVFLSEFQDRRNGVLIFGRSSLAIIIGSSDPKSWTHRVDMPYLSIESVTTGTRDDPAISFTLTMAPKMFRSTSVPASNGFAGNYDLLNDELVQALSGSLNHLTLSTKRASQSKIRISSLGPEHTTCVGSCFVYRLDLGHEKAMQAVAELLSKRQFGMPSHTRCPTRSIANPSGHQTELRTLKKLLSSSESFRLLPFVLKFQIEKLAVNGFLRPQILSQLLPRIKSLGQKHGIKAITHAVMNLERILPVFSPYTEIEWFFPEFIGSKLQEGVEEYRYDGSLYNIEKNHEHIALIHRVTITPAGYYLEGPFPETINRVLRTHVDYVDHFIRVLFADESGDSLRFDPISSPEEIYEKCFRTAINGSVDIAGYKFAFLGFSHSSLRSQTCWFMAAFVETGHGELVHPKEVIRRLGVFSSIKCPAKCAARIGQAFSDTNASVTIEKKTLSMIDDVERNDRVFSDGVGTISPGLLKRIWAQYAVNRNVKPNIFQIRFRGAKGIVSVDNRLEGEKLNLRPSMVKFEGKGKMQLEICGANFNPLPLYLNRPLIKILEDLGVPAEVFIDLQATALETLRLMTINDVNAAHYLETNRMGGGQRLPSLLRFLSDIGLSSQSDRFLRDTIEVAALVQLREIKHRARIPVENGVTLYGIMDETGLLKEGEIFCSTETEKDGRRVVVGGRAAITRSPALHPGDVQIVQCVDVPDDSPLNALHNCIVFSQKGERDLPSQLSGGDLDGDLYNIIFERRLIPSKTTTPADYPRPVPQLIDREVETEDMTNFFIEFMKSDQLGRISNIHLQLADRYDEGTFHPDCLVLAELASVAVDFSKTGVPINIAKIPKYGLKDLRPDFMAPGPRVQMSSKGILLEEEDIMIEEKDDVLALDPDFQRHRYYESEKVLGKLYRAIDESKFFKEMHTQTQDLTELNGTGDGPLMEHLWRYIEQEATLVQWRQYVERAEEIRNGYETNIFDTMMAYSSCPSHPLTEIEVFSGAILGKSGGAANKKTRELESQMKAAYERDVTHFRDSIRRDYSTEGVENRDQTQQEALPRSMACLYVGLRPGRKRKGGMVLQSFKYVAAEICLAELVKWKGQGPLLKRIS